MQRSELESLTNEQLCAEFARLGGNPPKRWRSKEQGITHILELLTSQASLLANARTEGIPRSIRGPHNSKGANRAERRRNRRAIRRSKRVRVA